MIALTGAPEVVVADTDALDPQAWELLGGLGLDVLTDVGHEPTVGVPSVGLFLRDRSEIDGCFAWFVGGGEPPSWTLATEGRGAQTSALMALVGDPSVALQAARPYLDHSRVPPRTPCTA